ncbi:MAG: N-acetyltransferase [Chitinophagales bacterium]
MNATIRIATSEDASALAEIGNITFTETWVNNYDAETLKNYLDTTYSREIIKEELQRNHIIYLMAVDGAIVTGFAKLNRKQGLGDWITDRCLEVCRIYVLKAYHDQKVGKLLMEKIIELAKEEKMESIVLGVWENNHRAVAFYKKWGFEMIGTHPFEIGDLVETDWVMRKSINYEL